jgi:cytoskeletal protein CcmA (bactofilin family)
MHPLKRMWGKSTDSYKPLNMTPAGTAAPPNHTPAERPQPERMQAPPPPARFSAAIGKTTRIRGDVYSEEELFFDGEVEGTIEVRHQLTIGPNGKIKASVKAKELVVRGSIQGDVTATDRISIMNGASIVGDVKTAGIVIEDGAYFKGGIDILRPETARPGGPRPEIAKGPEMVGMESAKAAGAARA